MTSTLAPYVPSKLPANNPDHLLPRQAREASTAKLRAYCASLKGRDLEVIRKHHPQLLSPKN